MRRFKTGFTLAEVLITIAIIGVVATMTLPALKQSYQKKVYETGIKKAYNTVTEAVGTYMADEGISDLGDAPFVGDHDKLKEFVTKYFKAVKICDNGYKGCFADTYYNLDKSASKNMSSQSDDADYVVLLADGTAMLFSTGLVEKTGTSDGTAGEDLTSGKYKKVLYVEVDPNGTAGPNICGRDFFKIEVNSDGLGYESDYKTGSSVDTNWTNSDGSKGVNVAGIGYLLNNGWDMDY